MTGGDKDEDLRPRNDRIQNKKRLRLNGNEGSKTKWTRNGLPAKLS